MASLTAMSYADMLLAMVPAAAPTRKNQRTTSCPAPISANVPYRRGSRFTRSALLCVSRERFDVRMGLGMAAVHSRQGRVSGRLTRAGRTHFFGSEGGAQPRTKSAVDCNEGDR